MLGRDRRKASLMRNPRPFQPRISRSGQAPLRANVSFVTSGELLFLG